MSGFLFDIPPPEAPPLAARLKRPLMEFADKGIFIGTSSWKYEGWLGSIYARERYLNSRGKFIESKFNADCLEEYSETFPVVGGDFSFYTVPEDTAYWDRVFQHAPEGFGMGLKVPEHLTVAKWPEHARYGNNKGKKNPQFLDADFFTKAFLRPLLPHRDKVPVLMFEFGAFSQAMFRNPAEFRTHLGPFLDALPGGWNYAVEIRNEEYLEPDYFSLLANHNVAHVLNAWTKMPSLAEQVEMPGVFTADFTVVRALLKKGRTYEDAVRMFEPYKTIKEPDPESRRGVRRIIERSIGEKLRAYLFYNNRLEGNAPETVEATILGFDKV